MAISRRAFLELGTLVTVAGALPVSAGNTLVSENQQVVAGRKGASRVPKRPKGPPPPKVGFPSWLTARHNWESLVDASFQVQTGGSQDPQSVWMTLLSVSDLPAAPLSPRLDIPQPEPRRWSPQSGVRQQTCKGFQLTFRGAFQDTLAQGTYLFEHGRLGPFSMFIVPSGQVLQTYTAVINRLQWE